MFVISFSSIRFKCFYLIKLHIGAFNLLSYKCCNTYAVCLRKLTTYGKKIVLAKKSYFSHDLKSKFHPSNIKKNITRMQCASENIN